MINLFGFILCRGKVLRQEKFNLLSNGGEVEILLDDGSRLMGKILPSTMSEEELNGERGLLHDFVYWGA